MNTVNQVTIWKTRVNDSYESNVKKETDTYKWEKQSYDCKNYRKCVGV